MRVGFYTPNYPGLTGVGGVGTYTRAQAREMVKHGHEVHVLTPGNFPTPTCDHGVQVHAIPKRHLRVLERFYPGAGMAWEVSRAADRIAREHRLEVFEFSNWEGRGISFLRSRRVPTVVRLVTSSLETQQIDGLSPTRALRLDVAREQALVRSADYVVTHSQAHREVMAQETGLPPEKISVIPLGVDCFPEYRRDEGLTAGGEPLVVFVGRMERRKGTVDLLNAVPAVLQRVKTVRFVFIGSDRPHCPGGRTHAEHVRHHLPPEAAARIELLGRLPDDEVNQWMQRATVFVAPSLYESFGLVLLEAMRWGTPVVGTRVGGIPEIVQDGLTGRLVPPADPEALASAIAPLLMDQEERERLGAAGRRHVEASFSIETLAARMMEFYAEALQSLRRRR